jgi:hypothetical protein
MRFGPLPLSTFYLKGHSMRVEPRGFEPLTSAVQRRYGLSVCVLARPRVWLKQAYFHRLKGVELRLCSVLSWWGCCTVAALGFPSTAPDVSFTSRLISGGSTWVTPLRSFTFSCRSL